MPLFAAGWPLAAVGLCLRWIRFLFPPVVTGTFIVLIGIILLPVGFTYVGGGFGASDFGASRHLFLAALVFVITVGFNQFTRGFLSEMAVLIGIVVGYVAAIPMGLVDFSKVANAGWLQIPMPFHIGLEFVPVAVGGVVLMAIVTSAESIGDITGTVISGANREPTDKELSGGVMADGLSSSFAAIFNAFPQISFSQNVGLVALTGVASRYVVAIGGGFLIIAGLVPKMGAVVTTIPNAVLGGAVVIMFGLIAAAGVKMLAGIPFNKRNMLIIGVSMAVAIGLPGQDDLYMNASEGVQAILNSGLISRRYRVNCSEPGPPGPHRSMTLMDTGKRIDRLLDVIADDIVPLTEIGVSGGNKVFGSAILRKDDMSLVIAGTNNEHENPLWHGEVHTLKLFYEMPAEERPQTGNCLFLATHEPCSLCLSAITWQASITSTTCSDTRIPPQHSTSPIDLKILQEVFAVKGGNYVRENAYWTSHGIVDMIAGLPDAERELLNARVAALTNIYAELSDTYQQSKGAADIPLP